MEFKFDLDFHGNFCKVLREYAKYCHEHSCNNKKDDKDKPKCKYLPYNSFLEYGKPCQDRKIAFTIEYMTKHK